MYMTLIVHYYRSNLWDDGMASGDEMVYNERAVANNGLECGGEVYGKRKDGFEKGGTYCHGDWQTTLPDEGWRKLL